MTGGCYHFYIEKSIVFRESNTSPLVHIQKVYNFLELKHLSFRLHPKSLQLFGAQTIQKISLTLINLAQLSQNAHTAGLHG